MLNCLSLGIGKQSNNVDSCSTIYNHLESDR